MNCEHNLLQMKREQFRVSIRRDINEKVFSMKRNSPQVHQNSNIQIPNFQTTQELHKYLIEQDVQQRLRAVILDIPLYNQIFNNALQSDYYAIAILCNLSTEQYNYKQAVLFFDKLESSCHEQNMKFLNNCLQGIGNILSNMLTIDQIMEIANLNFVNRILRLCFEIRKSNLIYTSEETEVLNSAIRTFLNFVIQFRNINDTEEFQKFKQDKGVNISYIILQLITIFNFSQSILKIHMDIQNNKCKCLNLMIQLLKINSDLFNHIENSTLEIIIKFLNMNDNLLIITSLKFLVVITSIEDENLAQRLVQAEAIEEIKSLINNQDISIRKYSFHVLSNLSACESSQIRKSMAQDNQFYQDVVNVFQTSFEIDENILYLLFGLVVNCYEFISDEQVQDSKLLDFLDDKFDQLRDNPQYLIIGLKLCIFLIINYKIKCRNQKQLLNKIELLTYHDNDIISEHSRLFISEIEKNSN